MGRLTITRRSPLLFALTICILFSGVVASAQTFEVKFGSFYSQYTLKTMGDPLPGGDLTAADVKASTVQCGLGITNLTGNYIFNHTFYVSATFEDAEGMVTLTPGTASFTKTFSPYSSQGQTLTFTGMPDRVDVGCITVTITDNTDTWDLYNTIYQLYSAPQAPMNTPWVEVLDYAVDWTGGDSTLTDCLRDLTTGLFDSGLFKYTGNTKWTTGTDNKTFLLSDFLNTTGQQEGNCVDVSDYLTICANALGLNLKVARYYSDPGYGPYYNCFYTNYLCPIGKDASNNSNYSPYYWGLHQFAFSNGGSGNVYDPTAAFYYNLSGTVYKQCPYNWPWTGYWQTYPYGLVNDPYSSSPVLYDPPGVYAPEVE
jgi:hypothetical protein